MRGTTKDRGLYHVLCAKCGSGLRGEVCLLYLKKKIRARKLLRESERCARALLRWGVRPGSAVFVCVDQTPELIYILLALWKLGAIAHLMNPQLPPALLRERLNQRGGELLFLTDEYLSRLQPVLEEGSFPQCVMLPAVQSASQRGATGVKQSLRASGEERPLPRCMLWKEFVESGQPVCSAPNLSIAADQIAAVCYAFAEEKEGRSLSHRALCAAISLEGGERFAWVKGGRILTLLSPWQPDGLAAMLLALYHGQRLILEPQSATSCSLRSRPNYVLSNSASWLVATREAYASETGLSFLRGVYALQNVPEELYLYHLVF